MAKKPDLNFDPEFASPAQWAALYRAYGLQVIPCYSPSEVKPGTAWKRPYLSEWTPLQEKLVSDAVFARWYDPATGQHRNRINMGLLTGRASDNVFVIDLDTYKSAANHATRWWQGLLALHNNNMELETPCQRTGGGGLQLLFRAPPGWAAPTNRTGIGVDIRGQGGFAVLPPSLHESGRNYEWWPGRAPWEMPILDAPQWLLDEVVKLVEAHGGHQGGGSSGQRDRVSPQTGEFDDFGNRTDGREQHMRDLIWAAMTGFYLISPVPPGLKEHKAVWLDYLRNTKTRLPDIDDEAGLELEGRGKSLFDQKWAYAISQWDTDIQQAAQVRKAREEQEAPRASEPPKEPPRQPPPPPPPPPPGSTGASPGAKTPIPLVAAFPIEEGALPVRDWSVVGLFLRRHLSVLVAPPGSGKSLLTLQFAIMVATGMEWGGWKPRKPEKVLIINAEDDIDEMRRRLVAAAKTMGVDQGALVDQIFLVEAASNIVIARMDARSKSIVRTPLVETLVDTIKIIGAGLVIADPFAETFEGDENSNSEVKWAGILWREVARRTACSLLLVHHTKKYASGMAGEADASRGGGALIGTARILSTLFTMTEDEALLMDVPVEDKADFVRFDDAKANFSKKATGRWFKKETVQLNNGTGFLPGDEVGVLVPWMPPDALSGMSMREIGMVLDLIDRGVPGEDGAPSGQFYAGAITSSSKERWAGKVLIRVTQCNEASAKNIIKLWIKKDVLEEFEYRDPLQRKARKGVRSVPQNRPDRGGI